MGQIFIPPEFHLALIEGTVDRLAGKKKTKQFLGDCGSFSLSHMVPWEVEGWEQINLEQTYTTLWGWSLWQF